MTAEILRASASELASRIASGDLSSVEVTQAHLDQIAAVDGDVHAFLALDGTRALASAAGVDAKRAAGETLAPLAGVPVAVKDLFCYEGLPTTAGSRSRTSSEVQRSARMPRLATKSTDDRAASNDSAFSYTASRP